MIEKAINNILSNDAQLNAIGVSVFFGIVNNKVDNNNWIVFYRNSTEPFDTKTGRSTLDQATIQVNIFSNSANTCANMAEISRDALDRKSGIFNSVNVQSIQFVNQVSLFEFSETYNKKGEYQISQFYNCRTTPNYQ